MSHHHNPKNMLDLPLMVFICLYVLECEPTAQGLSRYYVGVTRNLSHRFSQHFSGKGSCYTKKYPPIRVVHVKYKATISDETKYTLALIRLVDIGRVRGGP